MWRQGHKGSAWHTAAWLALGGVGKLARRRFGDMPPVARRAARWVGTAGLVALGWQVSKRGLRRWLTSVSRESLKQVMTDEYSANLWEAVSAGYRFGPQDIVELNLRAQSGILIERPFGSIRRYPSFDDLMFDIAHLHRMPTPMHLPLDTELIIGPRAKKPIRCSMPIVIAAMAYAEALSEEVKVALAGGASMVGTATNTGEGFWLPSERRAAKTLILELNRGTWNRTPDIWEQVDGVEIQFGQGALGSGGHAMAVRDVGKKLGDQLGLLQSQYVAVESSPPGVGSPDDLPAFVGHLRAITGGVPIGAKLAGSKRIEEELDYLIAAGVDFISIDGAEAATRGAPPILADDFGLPTLMALSRAARHLERRQQKGKITLLIGGRVQNPGRMLKALALGADGVFIGTAALYAVTHTQVMKALPVEPPTQVIWFGATLSAGFKADQGARRLANYLLACNAELKEGLRSLGYTSIRQVRRDDLLALDRRASEITGCQVGWEIPDWPEAPPIEVPYPDPSSWVNPSSSAADQRGHEGVIDRA